jgi:aryl-alcohol dehydrogenase-like predicted oxidoreductase
MASAVGQGLTRSVGVSNYGVALTRESWGRLGDLGVPLASNQVEFSLLERGPETSGLIGLCRDLGITVIAYSPLAMGLLTGKFTPSNPLPLIRRRAYWGIDLRRLGRLIGALREVGQAHGGKTPGQVALNWVLAQGALPIPGAKNATQARENAGALGWRMTDDEARHLERIAGEVVGVALR